MVQKKFMITYRLPCEEPVQTLNYLVKIDTALNFAEFKKVVEPFLFNERRLPLYVPRYFWKTTGNDFEIEIDRNMDYTFFLEEFSKEEINHVYVSPMMMKKKKNDTGSKNLSKPLPKGEGIVTDVVVHDRVSCDGCQMDPVVGFRYKCVECPNFDLCQDCEANHKHSEHMMLRIPNTDKTIRTLTDVKNHVNIHRMKKERKIVEHRCFHKSRRQTEEEANADQSAGIGRSSSGENRRHGRRHHKRHARNSFFTNLYEMMQDFAENSASAAFAAANVAINAASGVGDNNAITAEAAVNKTPVTNATAAKASSNTNEQNTASDAEVSETFTEDSSTSDGDMSSDACTLPYSNKQPKQQESTKEQVKIERKKTPTANMALASKGNLTESLINFAKITADLLAYEQHAANGNGNGAAAAAQDKPQTKSAVSKEQEKQKRATETETQMPSTASVTKAENKKITDDNIIINKQPTSADNMKKPVGDLNGNRPLTYRDIDHNLKLIHLVNEADVEPPIPFAEDKSIQSDEQTKDKSAGTSPSLGNSRSSSVLGDWQLLDGNSSFEHQEQEPGTIIVEGIAEAEAEASKENTTSSQQTQTAQNPTVSTSTASTNTDVQTSILTDPIYDGPCTQLPPKVHEMRAVPVYHADERINNSVLAMMSMGFSNEGAWLTQLLENVDGNIDAALDLMSVNPRSSA